MKAYSFKQFLKDEYNIDNCVNIAHWNDHDDIIDAKCRYFTIRGDKKIYHPFFHNLNDDNKYVIAGVFFENANKVSRKHNIEIMSDKKGNLIECNISKFSCYPTMSIRSPKLWDMKKILKNFSDPVFFSVQFMYLTDLPYIRSSSYQERKKEEKYVDYIEDLKKSIQNLVPVGLCAEIRMQPIKKKDARKLCGKNIDLTGKTVYRCAVNIYDGPFNDDDYTNHSYFACRTSCRYGDIVTTSMTSGWHHSSYSRFCPRRVIVKQ